MSDDGFEQTPEQLRQFLDFMEEDLENIRRAVEAVEEDDLDVDFLVHSKSETVDESVEKKGMEKSRIVKTLVFKAGKDFVAVLCPGDRRVSEEKLEEATGEEVRMAEPEEVEEATGYTIGGVSPFDLDVKTFVDSAVMQKDIVNSAAGSRVVGANFKPEELEKHYRDKKLEVKEVSE
ncbi:MAG: aminoacyl-tRNA deacylase [Candidatus Nanohaloarchaea archaeon]